MKSLNFARMVANPRVGIGEINLRDLLKGDNPEGLDVRGFTDSKGEEWLVKTDKAGKIQVKKKTAAKNEAYSVPSADLEKEIRTAFLDVIALDTRSVANLVRETLNSGIETDYSSSTDKQITRLTDLEKRALIVAKIPAQTYLDYLKEDVKSKLDVQGVIDLHKKGLDPKAFKEGVRLETKEGVTLSNDELLVWLAYSAGEQKKSLAYQKLGLSFGDAHEILDKLPAFNEAEVKAYVDTFGHAPKLLKVGGARKPKGVAEAILEWEKSGIAREFIWKAAEIEGTTLTEAGTKTMDNKLNHDQKELERYGELKKRFTTLNLTQFLKLPKVLTEAVANRYVKVRSTLTQAELADLVNLLGDDPSEFNLYYSANNAITSKEITKLKRSGVDGSKYKEFRTKNPGITVDEIEKALGTGKSADDLKAERDGAKLEADELKKLDKASVPKPEQAGFLDIAGKLGAADTKNKVELTIALWTAGFKTAKQVEDLWNLNTAWNRTDLVELARVGLHDAKEVEPYLTAKGNQPTRADIVKMKGRGLLGPSFKDYRDKDSKMSVDDILDAFDNAVPAAALAMRRTMRGLMPTLDAADIAKLERNRIDDKELDLYSLYLSGQTIDQYCELKRNGVTGQEVADFFTQDPALTYPVFRSLTVENKMKAKRPHPNSFEEYLAVTGGLNATEILEAAKAKLPAATLESYRTLNRDLKVAEGVRLNKEGVLAVNYSAYLTAGLTEVDAMVEAGRLGVTDAEITSYLPIVLRIETAPAGEKHQVEFIAELKKFSYAHGDITSLVNFLAPTRVKEAEIKGLSSAGIALADVNAFYDPAVIGSARGKRPSLAEVKDMRALTPPLEAAVFWEYRGKSAILSVVDIAKLHEEGINPDLYEDYTIQGVVSIAEIITKHQKGVNPTAIQEERNYKGVDGGLNEADIAKLRTDGVTHTELSEYHRHSARRLTVDEICQLKVMGINGAPCGEFFRDFPGADVTVLHRFHAHGLLTVPTGATRMVYKNYLTVPGGLDKAEEIDRLHLKFDGVTIAPAAGVMGITMRGEQVVTQYRNYRNTLTADEMIRLFDAGIMPFDYGARLAANPRADVNQIIHEAVARGLSSADAARRNALKQANPRLGEEHLDLLTLAGVDPTEYRNFLRQRISVEDMVAMHQATPPITPADLQATRALLADLPVNELIFLWGNGVRPADLAALRTIAPEQVRDWRSNGMMITQVLVNEGLRATAMMDYRAVDAAMTLDRMRELNRAGISPANYARWYAVDGNMTLARLQEMEGLSGQAAALGAIAGNDRARNAFLDNLGLNTLALSWAREGRDLGQIGTVITEMATAAGSPGEAAALRRLVEAQIVDTLRPEYEDVVIEARREGRNPRAILNLPALSGLHESVRRPLITAILADYTWGRRAREWSWNKVKEMGAAAWDNIKHPSRLIAGTPGSLRRLTGKGLTTLGGTLGEGVLHTSLGTLEMAGKSVFSIVKIVPYGLASMAGTTVHRMKQAAKAVWFPPTPNWSTDAANAGAWARFGRRFKNTFKGIGYGLRYAVNAPFALVAGALGTAEGVLEGSLRGIAGYEAPSNRVPVEGAPIQEETAFGIRGMFRGIGEGGTRIWKITDIKPGDYAAKYDGWANSVDQARLQERSEWQAQFMESPANHLIEGIDALQWQQLDMNALTGNYRRLVSQTRNLGALSPEERANYQEELLRFLGVEEGDATPRLTALDKANRAQAAVLQLSGSGALRGKKAALARLLSSLITGPLIDDSTFEVPAAPAPAPAAPAPAPAAPAAAPAPAAAGGTP